MTLKDCPFLPVLSPWTTAMNSLPAILFEDKTLIAFDKPSGMLAMPDAWDDDPSNLISCVQKERSLRLFSINRPDRETSGIFLCAKQESALDRLQHHPENRIVRHLAIVLGSLPEPEMKIQRPLCEDRAHRGKMRTSHTHGRRCETRVKELIRWRGYSLVEAFPKEELRHQIRLHLASVGCPIVADAIYGSAEGLMLSRLKRAYKAKANEPERPLIGTLAFHAERVELIHPDTRQALAIEAPLPKAFQIAIKYLKQFAGL